MVLKKDKQKVLDEVFDDERIESFLILEAPEGVNRDFHILEKAYRGMKAEDFEKFLSIFKGDINATNPDGKTLLDLIKQHRDGTPYAEALKTAGANKTT